MTIKEESYRSLIQSLKLLEELIDPGKTPRVPSIVRDRARAILKHYPRDVETLVFPTQLTKGQL